MDGQQPSRPAPVLRAYPRPGEASLEALQPLLGFPEEMRVWNLHAVRSRYQRFQPEVYPDGRQEELPSLLRLRCVIAVADVLVIIDKRRVPFTVRFPDYGVGFQLLDSRHPSVEHHLDVTNLR